MKIRGSLLTGFFLVLFLLQGEAFGQPLPVASIIGSDTSTCLGDSVAAYITFSGEGPWRAVINDKDGEYTRLMNVTSPYTIYFKPTEDNIYTVSQVLDRIGQIGSTNGEVPITVNESTPVTITLDRIAYLYTEPGVALLSDPSGGDFSGNGVAADFFYPGIATPVGSPHTISCEYSNEFSCPSTDEIDIHVLYGGPEVYLTSGDDTINAVCDDAGTYVIRGSNLDSIPGTFELVRAGTTDPVVGYITDTDTLDNLATLDPAGLTGAFDIIYTYKFQKLLVSKSYRIVSNEMGITGIADLPDIACKNDDPYLLVPELVENDPGASYSFSGQGVSGNQDDGYYYDPASDDAPVGENEITLNYTSSNGCSSTSVHVVTNSYVPVVNFSLAPACLPQEGGIVTFKNLTTGKFSVDTWTWDFGDPGSGAYNSSQKENPEHFYAEPGSKQISLTATTTAGCAVIHTEDTVLTDEPRADFTWLSDCFTRGGVNITFVDRSTSSFSSVAVYNWTLKTASGGTIGTISSSDSIEFLLTSLKSYQVELQVEDMVGCSGKSTKVIELKPTVSVSSAGYEEDFNGEKADWFSVSPAQNSSWTLGEPDFTGFEPVTGDMAWYTDLPAHSEAYTENSWIQSPCFDFSSISKPLLQIDVMRSFDPGVDGAVLQYQDRVSEGWKTVGNVGEGMNWYNSTGIINQPGGSTFGWGLDQFNPDTDWLKASHDLAVASRKPHVKFRIIIGSGGEKEIGNQGFAFDNIFIGESLKKSLLEYFTNSSSVESVSADRVVDTFALQHSSSVIDLQYHMDYPGADLMNDNNPVPPTARSFQKGITEIPYAILDGGIQPELRYDFSSPDNEPDAEAVAQHALEIPDFDVVLSVNWGENSLEAMVKATCIADTFAANLDLYVAVIETAVTAYTGLNQDTVFRNVVLDMLPFPTGELLGFGWYSGKTESRNYSWDYKEYVEDIEDLAVVAFVQNRDNGQVMQAAAKYLTPQVGIKPRLPEYGLLTIYPNPANDFLNVKLGESGIGNSQLEIIDLNGKVVLLQELEPGFTIYHLNISHLKQGMYMLCLTESGVVKSRNKVIVTQ